MMMLGCFARFCRTVFETTPKTSCRPKQTKKTSNDKHAHTLANERHPRALRRKCAVHRRLSRWRIRRSTAVMLPCAVLDTRGHPAGRVARRHRAEPQAMLWQHAKAEDALPVTAALRALPDEPLRRSHAHAAERAWRSAAAKARQSPHGAVLLVSPSLDPERRGSHCEGPTT